MLRTQGWEQAVNWGGGYLSFYKLTNKKIRTTLLTVFRVWNMAANDLTRIWFIVMAFGDRSGMH